MLDTSKLRELVTDMLPQLGFARSQPTCEAILIRDGHYCGRHFQFESTLAVWRLGQAEVSFYSDEGALLATLPLDAENDQRQAA